MAPRVVSGRLGQSPLAAIRKTTSGGLLLCDVRCSFEKSSEGKMGNKKSLLLHKATAGLVSSSKNYLERVTQCNLHFARTALRGDLTEGCGQVVRIGIRAVPIRVIQPIKGFYHK